MQHTGQQVSQYTIIDFSSHSAAPQLATLAQYARRNEFGHPLTSVLFSYSPPRPAHPSNPPAPADTHTRAHICGRRQVCDCRARGGTLHLAPRRARRQAQRIACSAGQHGAGDLHRCTVRGKCLECLGKVGLPRDTVDVPRRAYYIAVSWAWYITVLGRWVTASWLREVIRYILCLPCVGFCQPFLTFVYRLLLWLRNIVMAGKHPEPVVEAEKNARVYDDKAELESVKPAAGGLVDYTGSVAKTDPREIALVRKIDWRLMVRISGLNTGGLLAASADLRSLRCVQCTSW